LVKYYNSLTDAYLYKYKKAKLV